MIAAYKSVYIKFNFDQSIKDHFLIDNSPEGGGSVANQPIFFSREDAGITIGYSVLENGSVFAGYTSGEIRGLGIGEVQDNPTAPAIKYLTVKINEKGPFVGISYSYYLQDSGSFSFSVAYAQLDGEVSVVSSAKEIFSGAVTVSNEESKGDANGLSYSVTWSDQFSEEMLYNMGLKTTFYEYRSSLPASGNSLDFDDKYTIFSIGFSKFF